MTKTSTCPQESWRIEAQSGKLKGQVLSWTKQQRLVQQRPHWPHWKCALGIDDWGVGVYKSGTGVQYEGQFHNDQKLGRWQSDANFMSIGGGQGHQLDSPQNWQFWQCSMRCLKIGDGKKTFQRSWSLEQIHHAAYAACRCLKEFVEICTVYVQYSYSMEFVCSQDGWWRDIPLRQWSRLRGSMGHGSHERLWQDGNARWLAIRRRLRDSAALDFVLDIFDMKRNLFYQAANIYQPL